MCRGSPRLLLESLACPRLRLWFCPPRQRRPACPTPHLASQPPRGRTRSWRVPTFRSTAVHSAAASGARSDASGFDATTEDDAAFRVDVIGASSRSSSSSSGNALPGISHAHRVMSDSGSLSHPPHASSGRSRPAPPCHPQPPRSSTATPLAASFANLRNVCHLLSCHTSVLRAN